MSQAEQVAGLTTKLPLSAPLTWAVHGLRACSTSSTTALSCMTKLDKDGFGVAWSWSFPYLTLPTHKGLSVSCLPCLTHVKLLAEQPQLACHLPVYLAVIGKGDLSALVHSC